MNILVFKQKALLHFDLRNTLLDTLSCYLYSFLYITLIFCGGFSNHARSTGSSGDFTFVFFSVGKPATYIFLSMLFSSKLSSEL